MIFISDIIAEREEDFAFLRRFYRSIERFMLLLMEMMMMILMIMMIEKSNSW